MAIYKKSPQLSMFNIIKILGDIPKVYVHSTGVGVYVNGVNIKDINGIYIEHENIFVPDMELEWCPNKKHFRVYTLIADRTHKKQRAGYSILVVGSRLEAANFVDFYSFICRNRAMNKENSFNDSQMTLSLK